jgi:hypothetical protein
MSLKYLVSSTQTSTEVKKVGCGSTQTTKVNADFLNESYMYGGKGFVLFEEKVDL